MSEKIEEKVIEESSKKKKKKVGTKGKLGIMFVLLCAIAGLAFFIYSSLNWTAEEIFNELKEKVPTLSLVSVEDNVVYFKDSDLKKEVSYCGVIEVFENKTEALLKKEYYELYDQEMVKVFNEDLLGVELAKMYSTGKWKMYVNGNTLIRFSYHYTDYQVKQLNKQFNLVMDRVYQTDKNEPTAEEKKVMQKNYKKQVEAEVKLEKENFISALEATLITLKAEAEFEETTIDRLQEIKIEVELYKNIAELGTKALEVQTIVDDIINGYIKKVDDLLDEAINTYSREKVQEAKDAIASLTHDLFTEYKDPWNKRVEQILYQIQQKEIQDYKDACAKYNYYDIDESYKGKQAYFYGKIYRITTNTNGGITLIVNTEPQYLLGSIAYWTNSIYVDMDKDISAFYSQGDLIELWGTLEGMVVNEQVFGDAKTYPKFNCKYASK